MTTIPAARAAGGIKTWALDHVAVPAYDVKESAAFYTDIVGLREATDLRRPSDVGARDSVRFVSRVAGELHLARPDPSLARSRGSFIDPLIRGHAAIRVPDLDKVRQELTKRGVYFADADLWPIEGYRRIYVMDPSMNCIEVNERSAPAGDGDPRSEWKLEHIFAPAHDVRESAAFYSEIVGMIEVPFPAKQEGRGTFSLDPADLAYFADPTRAHVDVLRPSAVFARDNRLHINPLAAPHFAIQVPDIQVVKRRLDDAGVFYGDAGHFALQGLYQVYLHDPAMNLVEVCQRVT